MRWAFIPFGMVCVGLGMLGAVIPMMPSTVFFIVALWAFKRSSPKLESWLLHHKLVGPVLRDWTRNGSIARPTKYFAIAAVLLCICFSIVLTQKLWLEIVLGITAVGVSAYIWFRPEAE